MKKRIVVLSLLLAVAVGWGLVRAQSLTSQSIRQESGLFLLAPSDYLKVNLANVSNVSHSYRVVVFGTTNGATLNTVLDTGTVTLSSGQGAKAEYFVPSNVGGNDYGVEITSDSDTVIPTIAVFANCPNNSCPAGVGPRYWQAGSQLVKFVQQF